jgi:hypothetical protein
MTTLLMSSVVDGSIVALGMTIAVVLLISALVTSESRSVAKLKSLRVLARTPMKRAAQCTHPA